MTDNIMNTQRKTRADITNSCFRGKIKVLLEISEIFLSMCLQIL